MFKCDADSGTSKYFPNPHEHVANLEIHDKSNFESFQMQFFLKHHCSNCQNIPFTIYSIQVIWRNLKIYKMCNITLDKMKGCDG